MFHENFLESFPKQQQTKEIITHCAGLNRRVAGAGLELSFGYLRWVIDLGFFTN